MHGETMKYPILCSCVFILAVVIQDANPIFFFCAVLICHLCPARFCHILPHYLINGEIWGGGNICYCRYLALGPVWAQTRAQSGDWYGSGTLNREQVLRGSLPLLSPGKNIQK